MIQAGDIGELFAIMRAAYGHQWPHGPDDIPVWLRKLGGFNRSQVMAAAARVPNEYQDYPPSLGQFEAMVGGPPKRANTYLPPPETDPKKRTANLVLLKCLVAAGGVDKFTLTNLVALKNALAEEWTEVTQAAIDDMKRQLWALVQSGRKAA